ncbi:amino acid permease [Planctomicrobium sp. SH668]|uniref:amino acid permease n=1 Tax=Planctomicrobium sp. SH668 TaxID=3448126 RepID=UPI003F5B2261
MALKQLFERKSVSALQAEARDESRLHRVLGPVALTSLGVGAIIGAGIFSITGRVAAEDAGPAVMLSFAVAGIACLLAALCYSEIAAMVPVAGSAYTYAYATMGEFIAWIIGWDLILEYSMACSVVASHWANYLNVALKSLFNITIPARLTADPFTKVSVDGVDTYALFNLPAILVIAALSVVLVRGIRHSAAMNTLFVVIKVTVVLFVVGLGALYIDTSNWTNVPKEKRRDVNLADFLERNPQLADQYDPKTITGHTTGKMFAEENPKLFEALPTDQQEKVLKLQSPGHKWGLLEVIGVRSWLEPIDNKLRSNWLPYGISGMLIGASLVFFSYIGFDSISTHAEEARNPTRDVPLAIVLSLIVCTLMYMAVAGVITAMVPYNEIDTRAALAAAFSRKAEIDQNIFLNYSAGAIAVGAVTGLTSVMLVMLLSQTRIFMAMARDGLLPEKFFADCHPKFKTPHRSTILTGTVVALVAGFLPIRLLEEMVSIGTLMAFAIVCAAAMILRVRHPDADRPFKAPLLFVVAPLGIAINVMLMLCLPVQTWSRLVIWLIIGITIYLVYGIRHSRLRHSPHVSASIAQD